MAAYTTVQSGNWESVSTWTAQSQSGTITTSTSSATVTGSGTSFTTALSVGSVVWTTGGGAIIGTVQSITNNTTLVLTGNAASTNAGVAWSAQALIPGDTTANSTKSHDTVSIGFAVTVNAGSGIRAIGNFPVSGSAPAIALTSGGSLTVASGALNLQANLQHAASNTTVTFAAGTSLVFQTFSGENGIDFKSNTGCFWYFNGTQSSPCSVSSNTASGAYPAAVVTGFATGADAGIITASYTNINTTGKVNTAWGFGCQLDGSATNVAVSYTNCTFTASSCYLMCGDTNNWDGNITFTNNTFTSSVGESQVGQTGCCFFGFLVAATSGTRTIQYNSFDLPIVGTTCNGFALLDSYCHGAMYFSGTFTHASNAIQRCVFINTLGATFACPLQNSATDIYLSTNTLADQHYVSNTANVASGAVWSGFVWESLPGTTNLGNTFLAVTPTSASTALTIQNSVVLPGCGTIDLGSAAQAKMLLSLYHITMPGGGGANPPGTGSTNQSILLSESGTGTAHSLANYKACLIWWPTLANSNYKAVTFATGSAAVDQMAPTAADYNGSWNVPLAIPYPSSPVTGGFTGRGYNTVQSAVPGAHDLADTDPHFVDSTRNLANWGLTIGQASQSATLAYLAANPSQVINMIRWIRAGFVPQNAVYSNYSYPGDPSTADANGNAWPGSGPGVGAMAWLSAFSPWIFGDQCNESVG